MQKGLNLKHPTTSSSTRTARASWASRARTRAAFGATASSPTSKTSSPTSRPRTINSPTPPPNQKPSPIAWSCRPFISRYIIIGGGFNSTIMCISNIWISEKMRFWNTDFFSEKSDSETLIFSAKNQNSETLIFRRFFEEKLVMCYHVLAQECIFYKVLNSKFNPQ